MRTTMKRIADFDSVFTGVITPEFRTWLIGNGFFVAPASAWHHGNYAGGLFDHSWEVMTKLVWLTDTLDLKWDSCMSPFIVGMFHDLCKIDSYIFVNGNHFEYDYSAPKGHGDKSVEYLKNFYDTTEEEELSVRWHMGAFDTKENWEHYSKAVEKYGNVLYTHTADMIASKIVGI